MRFSQQYPDFAAIEAHVQRARVQRSVAIAQMIADGLEAIARAFTGNEKAEADRRHVAAEPFLRRSIQ
jgi:quinol monooxygenase YgiN